MSDREFSFRNFYLDDRSGRSYSGNISLNVDDSFKDTAKQFTGIQMPMASFTANYAGKTAGGGTKLRGLEKFRTSSGAFMPESPRNVTISRKDGRKTFITLNASGMETVKGTFLVRSLAAGPAGELTFSSGYGGLIEALGFNTVQGSQEGSFTVSVCDAHTGTATARNVRTSGNDAYTTMLHIVKNSTVIQTGAN